MSLYLLGFSLFYIHIRPISVHVIASYVVAPLLMVDRAHMPLPPLTAYLQHPPYSIDPIHLACHARTDPLGLGCRVGCLCQGWS